MPDAKRVIVSYVGDETPSPEAEQDKHTKRIFNQRRQYPDACLRCGGDGGVPDQDEPEDDLEVSCSLCPGCLGQGKCPRCKASLPDGWEATMESLMTAMEQGQTPPAPVKCRSCRWTDGDPPVIEIQEG